MPTYHGWNIVTMPDEPSVRNIEFTFQDVVATVTSPFTGQQQILDWQASWMEADMQLPPMTSLQAASWIAFLAACKGVAGVFLLPDRLQSFVPTGKVPGGYWRLKSNTNKFSISVAFIYGMDLSIREAK